MRFLWGIAGLLCCTTALAEFPGFDGSEAEVMPRVLTPARLSQPQSQVPASVTVIDRQLIEASGAREIYQLLQLVPGMIAIKVDGSVPTVSYHSTQARDTRRILVLVDGRSQYLPGLARVLWNDMPLEIEDIERIEVTRGPASAAYGANAFHGVINIITRHPQEMTGTTVATRHGNNGVQEYRVTTAASGASSATRLTVASRADDGYDEPFDGEDRRDRKRIRTANMRSVFELSNHDTVEFLAGGSQRVLQLSESGSDFGELLDYIELPEDQSEEAFVQLVWQRQLSDRHQFSIQAYSQNKRTSQPAIGCLKPLMEGLPAATGAAFFSQEARDLFDASGRMQEVFLEAVDSDVPLLTRINTLALSGAGPLCFKIDPAIEETRHDIEVENTFFLNDATRVVVGANLRHDRGKSETYTNGSVDNVSHRVFGNVEMHLADPLFLNVGGYWENDDLNGTYFSPRVGLIYQFLPTQSLRLVWSESIRTMDLYERRADIHIRPQNISGVWASDTEALLGWDNPEFFAAQISDGSLKPERIRSYEAGYFARVSSLEWDLRVFREELYDLVSGAINPFSFRPDNLSEVNIQGAELQVSWRPHPRHLLRATGSRIDTRASHPQGYRFTRLEEALAADQIASLLWRYDIRQGWMLGSGWYTARNWSYADYERADLHLSRRIRGRHGMVEISGVVQHLLTSEPVVRRNNLYKADNLYWLSASVAF